MDEIPFYLRESINKIIDRRVKNRIDEEMAKFKEEVRDKLANEKMNNNEQIQTHIQEVTGRPNVVIANPKLEGTGLEWTNELVQDDPNLVTPAVAGYAYPYAHPAYPYGPHPYGKYPYAGHPYAGPYSGFKHHPYAYSKGTVPYLHHELPEHFKHGYAYNVSPVRHMKTSKL